MSYVQRAQNAARAARYHANEANKACGTVSPADKQFLTKQHEAAPCWRNRPFDVRRSDCEKPCSRKCEEDYERLKISGKYKMYRGQLTEPDQDLLQCKNQCRLHCGYSWAQRKKREVGAVKNLSVQSLFDKDRGSIVQGLAHVHRTTPQWMWSNDKKRQMQMEKEQLRPDQA